MRRVLLGGVALMAVVGACDRPAPVARKAATGCPFNPAELAQVSATARDTIAKLKSRAQIVTEVDPVHGGVAVRTEDVDSNAFHNGGAVSVDCAKRVTSVWLDGG